MVRRRYLNFRESLDYQYANLLGNDGLYIAMMVTLEQLPKDIYFYYVQRDRRNGFYSLSKKHGRKTTGMFFTKTEIEMKDDLRYIEDQEEVQLFEKIKIPEEFFDFFNVKISLDKQISYADAKRSAGSEEEDDDEGNHLFMGKQGQY